ncbi:MAG: DNA repair protein RecO [Propionibacteriaceae bacterium]|nr:DNA repair protein RecO [Propionibacteriaceae bacterium]
MPTYRDRAVVLRAYKLGEADRIVTLLTQYNGKVRAVARGVRRTSSKFGGRLEPFSHVDIQLVRGRTLDVIAQVDTVAGYSKPLRDDYPRFTAGQVMLETADRLVAEEGEPALTQYHLLIGALHALGAADDTRRPTMILDSYLLRALASAGYKIALATCARCGQATLQRWFSATSGGLVCAACKPPGASPLDEPTWVLLGALLAGDWTTAVAATADAEARAHTAVDTFITWHMEHSLRSLPLLDVG